MTQRSQSKLYQALLESKEQNKSLTQNSNRENTTVLGQVNTSSASGRPDTKEIEELKKEKDVLRERIFLLTGQLTSEKTNNDGILNKKNSLITQLQSKIEAVTQENEKAVALLNSEIQFLKADLASQKQRRDQIAVVDENFHLTMPISSSRASKFGDSVGHMKRSFVSATVSDQSVTHNNDDLIKKRRLSIDTTTKATQCDKISSASKSVQHQNCKQMKQTNPDTEDTSTDQFRFCAITAADIYTSLQFDNLTLCDDVIDERQCCQKLSGDRDAYKYGNQFFQCLNRLLRKRNQNSFFSVDVSEKDADLYYTNKAKSLLTSQARFVADELKQRKRGTHGKLLSDHLLKVRKFGSSSISYNKANGNKHNVKKTKEWRNCLLYKCIFNVVYPLHEIIKKLLLVVNDCPDLVCSLIDSKFLVAIISPISRFYIDFCGESNVDACYYDFCQSLKSDLEGEFLTDLFQLLSILVRYQPQKSIGAEISVLFPYLLPLYGCTRPNLLVHLVDLFVNLFEKSPFPPIQSPTKKQNKATISVAAVPVPPIHFKLCSDLCSSYPVVPIKPTHTCRKLTKFTGKSTGIKTKVYNYDDYCYLFVVVELLYMTRELLKSNEKYLCCIMESLKKLVFNIIEKNSWNSQNVCFERLFELIVSFGFETMIIISRTSWNSHLNLVIDYFSLIVHKLSMTPAQVTETSSSSSSATTTSASTSKQHQEQSTSVNASNRISLLSSMRVDIERLLVGCQLSVYFVEKFVGYHRHDSVMENIMISLLKRLDD